MPPKKKKKAKKQVQKAVKRLPAGYFRSQHNVSADQIANIMSHAQAMFVPRLNRLGPLDTRANFNAQIAEEREQLNQHGLGFLAADYKKLQNIKDFQFFTQEGARVNRGRKSNLYKPRYADMEDFNVFDAFVERCRVWRNSDQLDAKQNFQFLALLSGILTYFRPFLSSLNIQLSEEYFTTMNADIHIFSALNGLNQQFTDDQAAQTERVFSNLQNSQVFKEGVFGQNNFFSQEYLKQIKAFAWWTFNERLDDAFQIADIQSEDATKFSGIFNSMEEDIEIGRQQLGGHLNNHIIHKSEEAQIGDAEGIRFARDYRQHFHTVGEFAHRHCVSKNLIIKTFIAICKLMVYCEKFFPNEHGIARLLNKYLLPQVYLDISKAKNLNRSQYDFLFPFFGQIFIRVTFLVKLFFGGAEFRDKELGENKMAQLVRTSNDFTLELFSSFIRLQNIPNQEAPVRRHIQDPRDDQIEEEEEEEENQQQKFSKSMLKTIKADDEKFQDHDPVRRKVYLLANQPLIALYKNYGFLNVVQAFQTRRGEFNQAAEATPVFNQRYSFSADVRFDKQQDGLYNFEHPERALNAINGLFVQNLYQKCRESAREFKMRYNLDLNDQVTVHFVLLTFYMYRMPADGDEQNLHDQNPYDGDYFSVKLRLDERRLQLVNQERYIKKQLQEVIQFTLDQYDEEFGPEYDLASIQFMQMRVYTLAAKSLLDKDEISSMIQRENYENQMEETLKRKRQLLEAELEEDYQQQQQQQDSPELSPDYGAFNWDDEDEEEKDFAPQRKKIQPINYNAPMKRIRVQSSDSEEEEEDVQGPGSLHNVEKKPFYKKTVSPDYIDFPHFPCQATVFAYFAAKQRDQKMDESEVIEQIIDLNQNARDGGLNNSIIKFKNNLEQKFKVRFEIWFPQSGFFTFDLLYRGKKEADCDQKDCQYLIAVADDHAWVPSYALLRQFKKEWIQKFDEIGEPYWKIIRPWEVNDYTFKIEMPEMKQKNNNSNQWGVIQPISRRKNLLPKKYLKKQGPKKQQKKSKPEKRENRLYFDIEAAVIAEENGHAPILLCLHVEFYIYQVGTDKCLFKTVQSKQMSGLDCIVQFVKFLREFKQRVDQQKLNLRHEIGEKKLRQRDHLFLFAHNGHKYDDIFILPELINIFNNDVEVSGSDSAIKSLSACNGFFIFRDTLELIPMSLAKACKDFGCEVQKDKTFNAGLISRKKYFEDEEYQQRVIKYCMQDVMALKSLYEKFVESLKDLFLTEKGIKITDSDIAGTISSTALGFFKKYFYKEQTPLYGNNGLNNCNLEQMWERASYFGGYTQVFNHQKFIREPGKEELIYIDIVSMYPSILAHNDVPFSQGKIDNEFQYEGNLQDLDNQITPNCLYKVMKFKFRNEVILTNLPVRNLKTKETVYPLKYKAGDAENSCQIYWGCDILLAVELGLDYLKISGRLSYESFKPIFKEYMLFFFAQKDKYKEVPSKKQISKLLMNSLYGKSGQMPNSKIKFLQRREIDIIGENQLIDNHFPAKSIELLNYLKREKFISEREELGIRSIKQINPDVAQVEFAADLTDLHYVGALVRIATFTTSRARCKLIRALHQARIQNVYYCDTDSIVMNKRGVRYINNLFGDKLGQFNNEFPHDVIVEAEFLAAKCYYLRVENEKEGHEHVKFKGIKKPSVFKLINIRETGESDIAQTQWQRNFGQVFTYEMIKRIILRTKRWVQIDGFTRPFKNFQEFNLNKKNLLRKDLETNNFSYKIIDPRQKKKSRILALEDKN